MKINYAIESTKTMSIEKIQRHTHRACLIYISKYVKQELDSVYERV